MSPTSCQTAPPRARRDKDYIGRRNIVSTKLDAANAGSEALGTTRLREVPDSASLHSAMSGFGQSLRREFQLEPGVDFINHGSFGAPPVAVLAETERWRSRMEANPDDFLRDVPTAALRSAAAQSPRFVRAAPGDIAIVENAAAAISPV